MEPRPCPVPGPCGGQLELGVAKDDLGRAWGFAGWAGGGEVMPRSFCALSLIPEPAPAAGSQGCGLSFCLGSGLQEAVHLHEIQLGPSAQKPGSAFPPLPS